MGDSLSFLEGNYVRTVFNKLESLLKELEQAIAGNSDVFAKPISLVYSLAAAKKIIEQLLSSQTVFDLKQTLISLMETYISSSDLQWAQIILILFCRVFTNHRVEISRVQGFEFLAPNESDQRWHKLWFKEHANNSGRKDFKDSVSKILYLKTNEELRDQTSVLNSIISRFKTNKSDAHKEKSDSIKEILAVLHEFQ